jgi:hypothetical protein
MDTDMGELMDAAIAAVEIKPAPTDDPSWQYANDMFVTAIEGGINYWSGCRTYHWDREEFYAVIVDHEDEDDNGNRPVYTIDREVIERGMALFVAGFRYDGDKEDTPLRHGMDYVRESILTKGEDGDFDAGDADNVVQLGLFGKVVYG